MTGNKKVVSDEDLQIFKTWIKQTPYLPNEIDDYEAQAFLVWGKGCIEKSKDRYDNYFKTQCENIALHGDFDPFGKTMGKIHQVLMVVDLPQKTPQGYTVLMTHLKTPDAEDYSFEKFYLKLNDMLQVMCWEGKLGNNEMILVLDCTHVSVGHCRTITPYLLEKIAIMMKSSTPLRVKGIYLVGLLPVLEWTVNLFMRFLPEKLQKRVKVFSDAEKLAQHIPRKILPKDYGGAEVSLSELDEKSLERLQNFRGRLIARKNLREIEAQLRPKTTQFQEMSGTFKKLAID